MLERDWATAEKWLADFPSDEFPDVGPKSFYQAQTALARGDVELARTLFEKVRPALESDVRDSSRTTLLTHAALGRLYALYGTERGRHSRRSPCALNSVRRAPTPSTERMRASDLALIYALTGEVDQAITANRTPPADS